MSTYVDDGYINDEEDDGGGGGDDAFFFQSDSFSFQCDYGTLCTTRRASWLDALQSWLQALSQEAPWWCRSRST